MATHWSVYKEVLHAKSKRERRLRKNKIHMSENRRYEHKCGPSDMKPPPHVGWQNVICKCSDSTHFGLVGGGGRIWIISVGYNCVLALPSNFVVSLRSWYIVLHAQPNQSNDKCTCKVHSKQPNGNHTEQFAPVGMFEISAESCENRFECLAPIVAPIVAPIQARCAPCVLAL